MLTKQKGAAAGAPSETKRLKNRNVLIATTKPPCAAGSENLRISLFLDL
jgi:hypothetical protein